MSYPVGVSLATVSVGSALTLPGGHPAPLSVTVSAVLGGSAKVITWAATGQPLLATPEEYTAADGEMVTFQVPHVDQSGFVDGTGAEATMWSYSVRITSTPARGQTVVWVKTFQPLVGQDTIDLDLVPDGTITAPGSSPLPAVLSVNGATGHVTIAGGGGSGVPDGGTLGQTLIKQSADDGDAEWADLPDASTAGKGVVELATTSETTTGTDTVRAVTPAGVKAVADSKVDVTALAALTATLPIVVQWDAGGETWGTYDHDADRVRLFYSQDDPDAAAPTAYNLNDQWFSVAP